MCFKSAIKSSGSVVVSHLNNNQIRKPGGKEIDSAMDHNAPDLVLRLPIVTVSHILTAVRRTRQKLVSTVRRKTNQLV